MNPAKLKVVELRAELSARGLDTKGNKAVLVERLQEALDQEEGSEGGDKTAREGDDSSEEQTEAQGRTETSEQEHETESESEPTQQAPAKVKPPPERSPTPELQTPVEEEPVEEKSPTPEKKESTPQKTESSPQKREPTPQKQEPAPQVTTPQKTPPKASTPQKNPTPQKTPVKEDVQMDVDELPKDEEKEEAVADKKLEIEGEGDVKQEEPGDGDSEYSKQTEENGVKEGYEQDVKSEIKSEDDIKTESDAVKSEPSESRESRKRRRSTSPRPRGQRTANHDREPDIKDNDVTLSWYDSDLNLTIDDKTFLSASPMSDGGFGYVWAGVRGTHGYTSGSLCYQVKVTNFLDVSHLEDEPNPNVLRVGWSSFSTSLQLGEEPFSYGYGGTGKFSVDCKFSNYGKPFSLNDVITCYLEFTNDEAVLSFGVNDEYLGVAQRIPLESLEGKPLAPHILTKNAAFAVNFGQEEVPWTQVQDNYVFLNKFPIEEATPGPRRPEKRSDCEMIMMCGLPGCGKTVWATKYAAEHPEKNYNILGTNFLIDKMKVMGLPRKANYHGRWDVLIEKCTKCLQRLMDIGSHRRRNYILDQTNVYPAAQRRKMRNFEGFTRKAVVIVPTDEEFKSRVEKQAKEEKKDVPESAVLEMKANFTLPDKNLFDEVNYVELQEEEAQALVQKYAKEAADKGIFPKSGPQGGPPSKRFRGGDFHHPKNDYRRDRFSSGPPSSPFRRGSDRGGPRGGGGGWGGRGGNGPMDRWRDNRNQGYGRPPQGDRQGWRGPPSGPPGGNGRGPRDYDRGPPRGGYDRNSRSGPPQRQGSGYNNRDHPRDARGPPGGPKPGMGGKPRPGDAGKHSAGGGPQSTPPAQWNNQYQNQGQAATTPNQAWGQQAQWNNANAQAWNNYQQQWKGYQQGYNQQGYSQGYNPQQYNNQWQQYYNQQYNQQGGGWGQNSDGTYNYPQSWQNWYAAQNAGQTNTAQPPPTAK
uniref:Heterogeneous nuclear ribonucleoprotein U-like protein 1 n=1 Tax=Lygus hesperus TaxID=30085 RepID=A0A0A9XC80_LYGHE